MPFLCCLYSWTVMVLIKHNLNITNCSVTIATTHTLMSAKGLTVRSSQKYIFFPSFVRRRCQSSKILLVANKSLSPWRSYLEACTFLLHHTKKRKVFGTCGRGGRCSKTCHLLHPILHQCILASETATIQ